MIKCVKCGSYAFNLYKEDIDQGGLCDVHYWQYRAHRAEALAEQPAQQRHISYACPQCHWSLEEQPAQQQAPVAWATRMGEYAHIHWGAKRPEYPMVYEVPLYTSPPAQRKPLTDEDRAILEAVRREMDDTADGNAPGHGHSIAGIWDEDNGDLAGKPCAWCLTWAKFTALIDREAAHGIKENT